MIYTRREKLLLHILKGIKLSSSHDFDHLENVVLYAFELAKIYKANRDVVIAAALVHDLGRSKPSLHSKKSASYSVVLAEPILKKVGYSQAEIKQIIKAVKDHDQPGLSSDLLEARILKDADFLDGFGIRGIMRSIYYTVEAGEPMTKAIERLTKKMEARYLGLEFPESVRIAKEQYDLTKLLMGYLKKKTDFKDKIYSGKFIVFEGISGTGKETQAKLLAKYLEEHKQPTQIIYHPTQTLKKILNLWRKEKENLDSEAFFFTGDRLESATKNIIPALRSGKVVISLRNYISTLVYQGGANNVGLIDYLYSTFEPVPDIIFYFYLKPEDAILRINKRTKETGEKKGRFERLDILKKKQEKYGQILKNFKNVMKIDALKSIDEIHQYIVNSLLKLWQKKAN